MPFIFVENEAPNFCQFMESLVVWFVCNLVTVRPMSQSSDYPNKK